VIDDRVSGARPREVGLVLQCSLYETTRRTPHAARFLRSQWVAKMIKPYCKMPNTEGAEPGSAKWRCKTKK
jgi:hypothetical protein